MSVTVIGRVAVITLLACGMAATARAQDDGQAAAEGKNAEGKQRMRVLDLEGAVRAFREAIAIHPDPRYYFNLCFTLNKLDRLAEAAVACEVTATSPGVSDDLRGKAETLQADIDRRRAGGSVVERPTDAEPETLADGKEAPDSKATQGAANTTSPETPLGPIDSSNQPGTAATPGPVVRAPSPTPPAKSLSLGVAAGLSIATIDAADAEAEARSGIRIGATLLGQLSSILAIESGLAFVQKGATADAFVESIGLVRAELDTSYLEIPVLLRVGIPGLGTAVPYTVAGPAIATLLSAKASVRGSGLPSDSMDVKDQYTSLDYALVAGMGVEIDAGVGAVVLDARYWLGLKDVAKADDTTARNRSFALTAGFVF